MRREVTLSAKAAARDADELEAELRNIGGRIERRTEPAGEGDEARERVFFLGPDFVFWIAEERGLVATISNVVERLGEPEPLEERPRVTRKG